MPELEAVGKEPVPTVTALSAYCPDCGAVHAPAFRVVKWPRLQEVAWHCPCCKNWKKRSVTFNKTSWRVVDAPRSMTSREVK